LSKGDRMTFAEELAATVARRQELETEEEDRAEGLKLTREIIDIMRKAGQRAIATLDEDKAFGEDRMKSVLVGKWVMGVTLAGKHSNSERFDCIQFTDGSTVRFEMEVHGDYQEGPKQNGQDAKLDEMKRLLLAQATWLAEQRDEIRALKKRSV
jgi:hypothetical protein